MKLKLRDEPKEWRKASLLSALGLILLSSLLCWRRLLPFRVWIAVLVVLLLLMLSALLFPRWFRGYYRFSARVGFRLSQLLGGMVLMLLFFVVLTPLGLALRLMGKDLLELKRQRRESYWHRARDPSPLDRLF